MKTRILGILLIIALVTSLMGITASAAECEGDCCCDCTCGDCNCYGSENGGHNGNQFNKGNGPGPCSCDGGD